MYLPRRGVVFADRRARLHRRAGNPRHPGFDLGDVRGSGKRGLGRLGIADLASIQTFEPWSSRKQRRVQVRGIGRKVTHGSGS